MNITYESKKTFRFTVNFKFNNDIYNMPAQLVYSIDRPSYKKKKYREKFLLNPIKLVLIDPISPSMIQKVTLLMQDRPKFHITLDILSPSNEVVEKWEIEIDKILEIIPSELNCGVKDILKITFILQPSTCKLVF